MADTVVDRMVVEIVANINGLRKGYGEAAKATEDVSKGFENVEKKSDDASDAMTDSGDSASKSIGIFDKLDDALDNVSKQIDGLIKSLRGGTEASDGAGKSTQGLAKDMKGLLDGAKGASGGVSGLVGAVAKAPGPIGIAVAGVAALAAGLALLSKAAIDAAMEFEEAMSKIIIGSGKIGPELDKLEGSLNNLIGTVAVDTGQLASILADLDTAYGVSGEKLESLALTYAQAGKIFESTDIVEKSRKVWNKWGVGVDQQTEKLDYFLAITQEANVKFDDLVDILNKNDRGFQLLGYSLEDTAAIIGTLVKEDDIDAAREFGSAIEAGARRVSDLYGSDSEARKALNDTIEAMQRAGDEQTAIGIGREIFGNQADKVAGAIYGGALAFKDLKNEALATGASIADIADRSETTQDKLDRLGAAFGKALKPIGDWFNDLLDAAEGPLHFIMDILGGITKTMVDFAPLLNPLFLFLEVVKKVYSTFEKWWSQHGSKITERLDRIFTSLTKIGGEGDGLGLLIEKLSLLLETGLLVALDSIILVLALLTGDWELAFDMMESITDRFKENFGNSMLDLSDLVSETINNATKGVINTISAFWKSIISGITNTLASGLDIVDGWIDKLLSAFEGMGQSVVDYFADMWNGIIEMFEEGFKELVENTILGDVLGMLGISKELDLSDYKITAPEISLGRSDVLQKGADSIRGVGTTINQQITFSTDKQLSALDVQRGIEKANLDLMRRNLST